MKKFITCVLLLVLCLSPRYVYAIEPDTYPGEWGGAAGAALCEATSGQILFEKSASEPMDVAGLARLPALLLVCRAIDEGTLPATQDVRVSAEAAKVKGASAFLDAGEQIKAAELLRSAVMVCAGDAIYALCETLEPSRTMLLASVNALLGELGIGVAYTDVNGTGAKFSASDLLKLGQALAQSPAYCTYSGLYYHELAHQSGRKTELVSSNKLLNSTAGCFGLATGSSPGAGYSGIYAVRRGDTTYICVVAGAKNNADRTSVAAEMIEYAFSAYKVTTLAKADKAVGIELPVDGGTLENVLLIPKGDVKIVSKDTADLTKTEQIPQRLVAPFSASDVVGSLLYTDSEGTLVATVELVPAQSVASAGFAHYYRRALLGWLHR